MQKVNRDWGWYLVLRETPNTKWKILYFRRGAKLSLQRHFKRQERWTLLLGRGGLKFSYADNPEKCETVFPMRAFETFRIPTKMWHQYHAYEPTIVLEKQTGICEEEDIERA